MANEKKPSNPNKEPEATVADGVVLLGEALGGTAAGVATGYAAPKLAKKTWNAISPFQAARRNAERAAKRNSKKPAPAQPAPKPPADAETVVKLDEITVDNTARVIPEGNNGRRWFSFKANSVSTEPNAPLLDEKIEPSFGEPAGSAAPLLPEPPLTATGPAPAETAAAPPVELEPRVLPATSPAAPPVETSAPAPATTASTPSMEMKGTTSASFNRPEVMPAPESRGIGPGAGKIIYDRAPSVNIYSGVPATASMANGEVPLTQTPVATPSAGTATSAAAVGTAAAGETVVGQRILSTVNKVTPFIKGAGVVSLAVGGVAMANQAAAGDYKGATVTAGGMGGGLAGAIAGAEGGALAGGALGSFVPVVGTAAGAAVGGFVGGVAGAVGGGELASKLTDFALSGSDQGSYDFNGIWIPNTPSGPSTPQPTTPGLPLIASAKADTVPGAGQPAAGAAASDMSPKLERDVADALKKPETTPSNPSPTSPEGAENKFTNTPKGKDKMAETTTPPTTNTKPPLQPPAASDWAQLNAEALAKTQQFNATETVRALGYDPETNKNAVKILAGMKGADLQKFKDTITDSHEAKVMNSTVRKEAYTNAFDTVVNNAIAKKGDEAGMDPAQVDIVKNALGTMADAQSPTGDPHDTAKKAAGLLITGAESPPDTTAQAAQDKGPLPPGQIAPLPPVRGDGTPHTGELRHHHHHHHHHHHRKPGHHPGHHTLKAHHHNAHHAVNGKTTPLPPRKPADLRAEHSTGTYGAQGPFEQVGNGVGQGVGQVLGGVGHVIDAAGRAIGDTVKTVFSSSPARATGYRPEGPSGN